MCVRVLDRGERTRSWLLERDVEQQAVARDEELLERLCPLAVGPGGTCDCIEREEGSLQVATRRIRTRTCPQVAADSGLCTDLAVGDVRGGNIKRVASAVG